MDAIQELRPSRDLIEAKRQIPSVEIRPLDEGQAKYVGAIAVAGHIEALAHALKENEQQRIRNWHDLAALDRLPDMTTFAGKQIERDLRKRLDDCRGLLKRQMPFTRHILSQLLDGRIAWTPRRNEGTYEFKGRVKFDQLLSGIVVTQGMVAVPPAAFSDRTW
jgi:hypothetical protein